MKTIKLTHDKITIVDDEDFDFLSQWKWSFDTSLGYAYRKKYINPKYGRKIYMHRLLLKTPKGLVTDHINQDRLDNRRTNLRICTVRQNLLNQPKRKKPTTSKYKGVAWHKQRNKWRVYAKIDGRQKHLGLFTDEKEAAKRYNDFVVTVIGDFVSVNPL